MKLNERFFDTNFDSFTIFVRSILKKILGIEVQLKLSVKTFYENTKIRYWALK